MNIQFRKLVPLDALAYRNIRLDCLRNFPDNFGSTFEEENKIDKLKFETYILEENKDCFIIGAFFENELLGICGFQRETRLKTRHRGEIVQMYVRPNHSNFKIGTKLLRQCIASIIAIGEIEQITLSVVAMNSKANGLYDKLGFMEYGRIKNYFKQGNNYWDQRFMILDLK